MTDTLTPSRPAASCRCPDTTPALPIYLDYAATTPVDPRVARAMLEFMTEKFGNRSGPSTRPCWTQCAGSRPKGFSS
jgi:cysteine desulfurase